MASRMAVYYDTSTDTVQIALCGGIGPGETVSTTEACDGRISLAFNGAHQLIGIELLDPDMLHPDLARHAIKMWPLPEGL